MGERSALAVAFLELGNDLDIGRYAATFEHLFEQHPVAVAGDRGDHHRRHAVVGKVAEQGCIDRAEMRRGDIVGRYHHMDVRNLATGRPLPGPAGVPWKSEAQIQRGTDEMEPGPAVPPHRDQPVHPRHRHQNPGEGRRMQQQDHRPQHRRGKHDEADDARGIVRRRGFGLGFAAVEVVKRDDWQRMVQRRNRGSGAARHGAAQVRTAPTSLNRHRANPGRCPRRCRTRSRPGR